MAAAQLTVLDETPRGGAVVAARDLSFEMQQLSARQIWFLVRRHLVLICAIVGTCSAAVLAIQLSLPNLYEATTTVQVELNDATGSNQADAARNQQRVANEARIYRSQALAEQVVRDLDLSHNRIFTAATSMTPQQATTQLMTQLRVNSANDSDFIDIVATARSPQLAARIANQFVDSLQKMRAGRRQAWRGGLSRALAAERDRLSNEVRRADQAVADFRRAHNMPIGAGSAEDYAQMNRVAVEAASAAALNSASAARASGIDAASRMRTVAGATSPALEQLQRQYDELLQQRSQLSVTLGSEHPDVLRVKAQLEQVGGDLKAERAQVVAALQAKNNAEAGREQQLGSGEARAAAARAGQLQSRLSSLAAATFRNNAANVELSVLDRRADVARQAYLTTAAQAQTVRSELQTTGVNSSIVSAATAPLLPVAPTPKKMTVAAFVGSSLLALLLVFCIEMFDNRLRSGEQLRRLFGLRSLAMLPLLPRMNAMTATDNPVVSEPQSLFAEVARNLASEVGELAADESTQSVLVTSPLPGDGKSSVALTLAAAAAASGRRCVIVDLDLRRPGASILRSIQTSSEAPDLLDAIADGFAMTSLTSPGAEDGPAATREPSTPLVLSTRTAIRDPASVVQGWRVSRLLHALSGQFDLIVINAPAVLAVRDARTLSRFADSTVMVVRWGKTTIEQMRAAMQLLGGEVAGAVFNQVNYPDHARRGYGDAVQFYMNSAAYYSDPILTRRRWTGGFGNRVKAAFQRHAA